MRRARSCAYLVVKVVREAPPSKRDADSPCARQDGAIDDCEVLPRMRERAHVLLACACVTLLLRGANAGSSASETSSSTCNYNGACKYTGSSDFTCKANGDCYCGSASYCHCDHNNGACYCDKATSCTCDGNNGDCYACSSGSVTAQNNNGSERQSCDTSLSTGGIVAIVIAVLCCCGCCFAAFFAFSSRATAGATYSTPSDGGYVTYHEYSQMQQPEAQPPLMQAPQPYGQQPMQGQQYPAYGQQYGETAPTPYGHASPPAPPPANSPPPSYMPPPTAPGDEYAKPDRGLPPGWEEAVNPTDGKIYYYNRAQNETTWKRPDY